MAERNPNQGRRRFKRYQVPVTCQLNAVTPPVPMRDIGLNGGSLQVDSRHRIGDILDTLLFFSDEVSFQCQSKVARCDALPPTAPAKYEVGLQFMDISPQHFMTLVSQFKSVR